MKQNMNTKMFGWFYNSSMKKGIKICGRPKANTRAVKREYVKIIKNAKSIGKSRLMSAYCMAAYFIAINRMTAESPETN